MIMISEKGTTTKKKIPIITFCNKTPSFALLIINHKWAKVVLMSLRIFSFSSTH